MSFLLIDKPSGITSHDVVDVVRKITGERRVGHAGTLDPFASGLLIVGVGRESTKYLSHFLGMDKAYEADITLGVTTATLDPESPEEIVPKEGEQIVTEAELRQAIQELTGTLQQIPPQYAAIKIQGKKMYELAREGKTVDAPPREVTVYEWREKWDGAQEGQASQKARGSKNLMAGLLAQLFPLPVTLSFHIRVSSGTYIRALARDLGQKCGTGGYLRYLRRTAIGPYTIEHAVPLHDLTPENWASVSIDLDPNGLYPKNAREMQ